MSVNSIQTSEPHKNNYGKLMAKGAMGAAIGASARYIVPTKSELSAIFNKDAVDTFVTNTSTKARGADRSILKYAGIGGAVAILLSLASKIFPKNETKNDQYSKYGALLDAPDYAVEIMWYGE